MARWWILVGLGVLLAFRDASAGTIELMVDKGHLIKLPQNADVVLVAEPEIANAVIESPRLIFVLGKRPGETNLFVMDKAGNLILTTDVVVSPNDPRQLTIYRGDRSVTMKCLPKCIGGPGSGAPSGAAAPAAPAGRPAF